MLYFYLIWIRSNHYQGQAPLTYNFDQRLPIGSIVEVQLQKEIVKAVVFGTTAKPRFKTKPIISVYNDLIIPLHLIKLSQWLLEYYPSSIGSIMQLIVPNSLSLKNYTINYSDNHEDLKITKDIILPKLTNEQQITLNNINHNDTYLLHGVTGSGKTRIYYELAKKTIEQKKSVFVLTPEISLTSQLTLNFQKVFSLEQVLVLHSQLTTKEKRNIWLKAIKSKEPLVVIGTRSSLFLALKNIGLIIIDEFHELSSFKQQGKPQYSAIRVASYIRYLTHATLILGSATPPISEYYFAKEKKKTILSMTNLAKSANTYNIPTKITTIDLKKRELFSKSTYLSDKLIDSILQSLNQSSQSLLYLNRRGTARLILCDQCNWQAICHFCDISLTYHSDSYKLICHFCGRESAVPNCCPKCQNLSIIYKTAGTKAIVEEVSRLFPNAILGRYDNDNIKKERFELNYHSIRSGAVDILIGTQLLAKGLDLPKLRTLGIINADTSLLLPDYTASERTYQLISQVIGRIGRGHIPGEAIIQTYNPNSLVIKTAINQDYHHFYSKEIESRQRYLYPPFSYLLKLSCRRKTASQAEQTAIKLQQALHSSYGSRLSIEGPAPAYHEKFQGKFQWQLIAKANQRSILLSIINNLPSGWSYDIDPVDLL